MPGRQGQGQRHQLGSNGNNDSSFAQNDISGNKWADLRWRFVDGVSVFADGLDMDFP